MLQFTVFHKNYPLRIQFQNTDKFSSLEGEYETPENPFPHARYSLPTNKIKFFNIKCRNNRSSNLWRTFFRDVQNALLREECYYFNHYFGVLIYKIVCFYMHNYRCLR